MNTTAEIFEVERLGDVVVLTPRRDLRELEFRTIKEELLALANDPTLRRVVVDFGHTDYLGSTALGMLVHLGQKVRQRGGRLAFCNLSPREREIFTVARLVDFWPTFPSREQALEAMTA
jgi:anti-anti-sigma factor